MYSDYHIHTDFSADSDTPAQIQIERAIALGMERICITDHQDFDYPERYHEDFTFPTDRYMETLRRLQQNWEGRIQIFSGVELGLRTHLTEQLKDYAACWPFDYIIGSVHLAGDRDPYFSDFYEGRTEEAAYREYFECALENVRLHTDCFDALGHLDYVVRYGPNKNRFYSYERYRDIIDEILKTIVSHGRALECNTSGLSHGLGHPNPHPDIIRRYVELGGEMVTVGSDAHGPASLGYGFSLLKDMLAGCGVRYYTEFQERRPRLYPL